MADIAKFYTWLMALNMPEYMGLPLAEPEIPGWCTSEQGGILNHAVSHCLDQNEEYLELGTFCGRSLEYALRGNKAQATVIDPLDLKVADRKSSDFWFDNADKYGWFCGSPGRVMIIKNKYEDISKRNLPKNKFGVVLIDGNHDTKHTLAALQKLEHSFADKAILIIDDYLIYGGNQQTSANGSKPEIDLPVKKDVDFWISKRFKLVTPIMLTPWLNGQIILFYNRSKYEKKKLD